MCYSPLMAERQIALVEFKLLVWARQTASLSLEEAAKGGGVPVEKLASWEAGEAHPSIPQLKKLAGVYKRPLSVFFLPEPPSDFMALRDFRRLALTGERPYSPQLAYEIRAAHERRAVAVDIAERLGEEPEKLGVNARITDDPENVAQKLRERLGVTIDQQCRWGDPTKAFRAWRDAIENAGVLVFALSGAHHRVPLEEVRGFAIAEDLFPTIVVNGKDRTNGRTFTLLHELGHVALGQSVIENEMEPSEGMPAPDRAIETFCNRVAAAVLMPRDILLAETIVAAKQHARASWTDAEIAALARRYSVSREALLVRLAELGRADRAFVQAKRREYARQYEEMEDEAEGGGFAPFATQVVSHLGRGFARLVLQGYYTRALTLSTASGYLGTQAKHVANIERAAFTGMA